MFQLGQRAGSEPLTAFLSNHLSHIKQMMRKGDRGIWHNRVMNKSLNVTSGTQGHKHFMLSALFGGNSNACDFNMKDFLCSWG